MPITRYSDRFGGDPKFVNNFINDQQPRISELNCLVKLVNAEGNINILNLPHEGPLLKKLAPNWKIDYADFEVTGYLQKNGVTKTCPKLLNIKNNFYNSIVGIVPIHHLNDDEQFTYLKAAKQKIVYGGNIVFAEPHKGSNTAYFLDTLIDRYSFTGHKGNYPTDKILKKMSAVGFKDEKIHNIDCGLSFNSEEQMFKWFKRTFGLRCDDSQVFINEAKKTLGFINTSHSFRLGWNMTFFYGKVY